MLCEVLKYFLEHKNSEEVFLLKRDLLFYRAFQTFWTLGNIAINICENV